MVNLLKCDLSLISESGVDNEKARGVSEAAFIHCLTSNPTVKYRICGLLTCKSNFAKGWCGNIRVRKYGAAMLEVCMTPGSVHRVGAGRRTLLCFQG
jgi:hypothetical protein